MTWKIATRYFRGKGTANAVPLLSRISMVAIAVCSAAMIIVLSVFNGLDAIVKQQYKSFCPNLKVSLVRGKFFPESAINLQALRQINGVVNLSPVIEDNALAGDDNGLTGSGQQQKVVSVKGIENNYFNVTDVASGIIEGVDTVSAGKPYTCIMGRGVADGLRSGTEGAFNYISLYYANPDLTDPESDPLNALTVLTLHPAGVFELDAEFDDRYVFAPLPLVQELLHAKGKYSAIEIRTDSTRISEIKKLVQQQVGAAYKVEDINDQNKNLFAMMGGEKYIVYMILLFVLVIASFNMVGALSVLVVTKQKDVAILRAMGASTPLIRNVFLMEGVLWSLAGGLVGIILGLIICLLQQHYGLLKMQASFSVDAFPVRIIYTDAVLVIVTIIVIGLAAAIYPAVKAARLAGLNLKSD
jgi:lipoprotein-releasing system permease protein